jgi:hypothetical protein
MAILLLQSAAKNAGAVTSSTLAYSSNVTAGSIKVAIVDKRSASSTLSCSDNLDGSWIQEIVANSGSSSDTLGIFSKPNATAGATTVTFGGTGGGTLLVDILEFSGVVTNTELDQTGHADTGSNSSTLNISTSGSTTSAIELVVAGVTLITSQTSTWGGGYTQDPNSLSTASVSGAISAAYLVTSSTGTQTASHTPGGNSARNGVIATFFTSASNVNLIFHRRNVLYFI